MDDRNWRINNEAVLGRYQCSLKELAQKVIGEELGEFEAVEASTPMGIAGNPDTALLRFFFGFDDVEHILHLCGDDRPGARFIFYIPELSIFLQVCAEQDLSELIMDTRVRLVLGKHSVEELFKVIGDMLSYEYLKSTVYAVLSCKSNGELQQERIYREAICQVYGQRETEVATYREFGTLPCRNELFALSVLNRNHLASALFQKLTDRRMPVILVGAGPSLERNVSELRQAKNKALIVCASHACRILRKAGIEPDLIAEIDSMDCSFCESTDPGIRLLISARASLADQKNFSGRCIYFSFDRNIFPVDELGREMELSDNSGSVMTESFELFIRYGFTRFIFVGQDLSYSTEGYTHAGGEYQTEASERRHLLIPGKDGGEVESRYDWIRFRDYYESRLKVYPELMILDATDGGALIKGTRMMSLPEAINEFCIKEYPIGEWLGELPKAQTTERYESLRLEMVKKTEKLKGIALQIPRAVMDNKRLQEMLRNGQEGTGMFSWICSQYDAKYHQILDSDASRLLLFYSEGMLQDYLTEKLAVEGEDKISRKLELEERLFTGLEEKTAELIEYMEELWAS